MVKRLLALLFGRGSGNPPASTSRRAGPPPAQAPAPVVVAVATDPAAYRELLQAFDAVLFDDEVGAIGGALSELEQRVLDHVEARVRDELPAGELPKLPATVSQLMRELNRDDAGTRQIEELVRRDPALAGDLLRLANSPAFRSGTQPVSSIEHALRLVGQEVLRSMVVALLMKPLLRIRPDYFERFGKRLWEHAMATAVACRALAREHDCDPFVAYFAGLALNVGRIALFRQTADTFARTAPRREPRAAVFRLLMQRHALVLAANIVRQWGVEAAVPLAIHDQERVARGTPPEMLMPFGRLLFRANLLAVAALLRREGALPDVRLEAALAPHGLSLALAGQLGLADVDV